MRKHVSNFLKGVGWIMATGLFIFLIVNSDARMIDIPLWVENIVLGILFFGGMFLFFNYMGKSCAEDWVDYVDSLARYKNDPP